MKRALVLLLGGACLVTGCAVSVDDGSQPPHEDTASLRADDPGNSPAVEQGTIGRAQIVSLPSVYSDPVNKPTPDPWFAINPNRPTPDPWSGSDPKTAAGADDDDPTHSSNGTGDGTNVDSTPSSTAPSVMPMR